MNSLYERDFHQWATEQAAALKDHRVEALDWENLGEEIEGLARSDRQELRSRLEVLLLHLIKWACQPNWRGPSWRLTVEEQLDRIAELLQESPSLNNAVDESFKRAWRDARRAAMLETGLPDKTFPQECPWPASQALDPQFWPESI
jgi:hypothetical protein